MKHKSFIVPHDFTQVAAVALKHAIETSKQVNTTIHILHVVEKQEDIASATDKIDEIIAAHKMEGITLTNNVRIGNIFTSIAEFSAEHHAEMIFMGTHGAHGWQHVVGSNALRVVTVPMDLHKETKQKLSIVASLAKYFGSKVHVVTPDESDEYLRHQVESNIVFSERFFKDRGIDMTSAIISSSGFDKEVVKYAVSVEADLIAIMNLNKNSFLSAITANYEQYIITNDALIPTLIVNPIQIGNATSSMFTT